jgi:chaperonin cofactor prefoldin
MKDLEKLEQLQIILSEDVKEIKEEIKLRTRTLQDNLKEKEKELKDVKKKIKTLNREKMQDKSVHVVERFKLWIDSPGKVKSDWIIESGPMRDNLFDDEYRYSTVGTEDRLIDWLWDELDESYENLDACIKNFEELDKDRQKYIADIIEDAIEQNVYEYTQDW